MNLSEEQKVTFAALCATLSDEDDQLKREVLAHAGNRWSLGVIYSLGINGPQRHAALSRVLDGVTQRMLTRTLRHLERDGLISRHDFQQTHPHPHVEYRLTPVGKGLLLNILPLWEWLMANIEPIRAARQQAMTETLPRGD